MTREQTQQVLLNLKRAYPFFYKDITPEEGEKIADLWYEMFENDDVSLVIKAVKLFIKTDRKGFPPVIGVIKDKMEEIMKSSIQAPISESEAWRMVKNAVTYAVSYKKEFDKLPPIIQSVIGDHQTLKSWGETDIERFETTIQQNFIKSYKSICEQEKNNYELATHIGINSKTQNKAPECVLKNKNDKLYCLNAKSDSRPIRSHE